MTGVQTCALPIFSVLAYWYDDVEGIEDMVNYDPDEAATWIADLFKTDSVTPSMLS